MALLQRVRDKLRGTPKRVNRASQLNEELRRRAVEDAADFIRDHLATALLLESKQDIRAFAASRAPRSGLVAEFGVYRGIGINQFADALPSRTVFGFDSFAGLSEDWAGTRHWKGRAFDVGDKLPEVRKNVRLIKGWIDDTLPPFLEEHKEPFAFIHIDTDTYAPCKTILALCKDRLVSGTTILFDELLCYPGWRAGEFKAMNEELDPTSYKWIAFAGERAALQIV